MFKNQFFKKIKIFTLKKTIQMRWIQKKSTKYDFLLFLGLNYRKSIKNLAYN